MHLTPSEYFARQCWVSFEIDETTLPALVPFVGADRIVWGSDYPHADSTFPGALDELLLHEGAEIARGLTTPFTEARRSHDRSERGPGPAPAPDPEADG